MSVLRVPEEKLAVHNFWGWVLSGGSVPSLIKCEWCGWIRTKRGQSGEILGLPQKVAQETLRGSPLYTLRSRLKPFTSILVLLHSVHIHLLQPCLLFFYFTWFYTTKDWGATKAQRGGKSNNAHEHLKGGRSTRALKVVWWAPEHKGWEGPDAIWLSPTALLLSSL